MTTETGHGSDVQQLRTTCAYDPATQTFDLHTPHQAARKDYIGNAARDGRMAVVFVQLITGGRGYGVHAWLVPNDTRRFFTMLGTLVRGRIVAGGVASAAGKSALTIAVRYGEVRRQFSAPGRPREVAVNDYLVHQRVLLTALAKTYALHFAQDELVAALYDLPPGDEHRQRELESRGRRPEAVQTWHATQTIQACREALGGAGYLAENRLPAARSLIQRLVDAVPGRDEEVALTDRGWHLRLFEDREKHLLESVIRRLRGGAEQKQDRPFDRRSPAWSTICCAGCAPGRPSWPTVSRSRPNGWPARH